MRPPVMNDDLRHWYILMGDYIQLGWENKVTCCSNLLQHVVLLI